VLLAVSALGLTGCDTLKGKTTPTNGTASSPGPSASPPATTTPQSPDAAKANACAVFNEASKYTNAAGKIAAQAVDDPKNADSGWDKPMSDSADNASVVLTYAADAIQRANTSEVPADLSEKLKSFIGILRDRSQLFAQHKGTDTMNASGDKYAASGKELAVICQPYQDVKPAAATSQAPQGPQQAKQSFCAVYKKNTKNSEDTAARFNAAVQGDANHPHPGWDDADGWLAGAAADASIIDKYAADEIELAISPSLPADLADKARTLVTAIRKMGTLLNDEKADQLPPVSKNEYAPAADAIDSMCGIS
jgi:hypothetical protein